ncbi:sulfotransferase [Candidatus Parcubacteria bacterium]|nr:MAG: sulfotransferase [Candidatus Parcubacteria bacterium]
MAEFLGDSLIFIISQPRAGSTLLQRILAAHPKVHTSAEPWLMLHPLYALKGEGISAEFDSQLAYAALQDFLAYYADGESTYLQALRCMAGVLYERALQGTGAQFFLDKTPRYYFIIPELYRLFPEARFIFLIRNPLAVLYSILTTWVGSNLHWLARHRHDLLLAPTRILEGIQLVGPNAVVVRYEELVTNPEQCVQTLCEKLELDYRADMLAYGNASEVQGRMGDQIGIHRYERPVTANLNKWHNLAGSPQWRHFALAYLETLGEKTIEEMGYTFAELKQVIEDGHASSGVPILPWHIAIRPQETWSREDWLVFKRVLAVRESGKIRGHLRFVRENYRPLIRSLLPV